jgi:DNA topoisomerase-1
VPTKKATKVAAAEAERAEAGPGDAVVKAKPARKPAAKKKAPAAKAKAPATKAKAAGAKAKGAAAAAEDAPEATVPRARKPGEALVIVESPAKAKTIKKYLGSGYIVKASVGHVKDLPKKKIGIDIEHGSFQPEYVVIETKQKVLAEIKEAAANVQKVLLAPDPDREGEAIAWHIAEEVRPSNPNIQRVLFNEITKKAIL